MFLNTEHTQSLEIYEENLFSLSHTLDDGGTDTFTFQASYNTTETLPDWSIFDSTSESISGVIPVGLSTTYEFRILSTSLTNGNTRTDIFIITAIACPPFQELVGSEC